MRNGEPIGRAPGPANDLSRGRGAELKGYLSSFLLAGIVGMLAGLAAIGFQWLTEGARILLVGGGRGDSLLEAARRLPWYAALGIPALGALAAWVLVRVVFREKGSYGVADIMETVSLRRGGVNARSVLTRSLGVCAVIGSGGSTGREGPIIQLGSALASLAGRAARLPPRDLSVLIACGAAAGMAGAYNAPIGAAMFVMEVILGSFVMEQFAPVIVASVASTLTVRAFPGTRVVYEVPHLAISGPWEAGPIFVLGLLSALAGWGFLRSLTAAEDGFHRFRLPPWAPPILGGLAVGAIGISLPEVWGNGYDAVGLVLKGSLGLGLMALLIPSKVFATAVTSGSGVGGGVFTPTLFVGAALGGAFGAALKGTGLPYLDHVDPGLYALVGMGSVLAATTHAPLMAILILFEMTLDAPLIAPLMLGAVTATVFARWIHADSIYTARLKRRGIRLPEGVEEAALLRTYARDLLRTDAEVLPANAPLAKVVDRFLNTRRDALYVVGDGGRYVGVARIHDVKAILAAAPDGGTIIALDAAVPVSAVEEDETIGAVLSRFDDQELDEVPVVASAEDPRFVGTLSRRDILAMLRHEVLAEPSRPVRLSRRGGAASSFVEMPEGWRLQEIGAPPETFGRPLDAARWTAERGSLPLVLLRTDATGARRAHAPIGIDVRDGDSIVVLAPEPAVGGGAPPPPGGGAPLRRAGSTCGPGSRSSCWHRNRPWGRAPAPPTERSPGDRPRHGRARFRSAVLRGRSLAYGGEFASLAAAGERCVAAEVPPPCAAGEIAPDPSGTPRLAMHDPFTSSDPRRVWRLGAIRGDSGRLVASRDARSYASPSEAHSVERYEPSDRIGAGAFPIAFLALPIAAAILAYPYQWLQSMPFTEWGHTFTPLAFGAAIGLLAGYAMRVAKVRSRAHRVAVVVMAVLAGDLASFYWGWREDESTLARAAAAAGERAGDPAIGFGEWLGMRVESGWIETTEADQRQARKEASRSAAPPARSARARRDADPLLGVQAREGTLKGGIVYVAWIGELLALGAAAWIASRFVKSGPFCEACNEWSVPVPLRSIISVDTHALRQAARDGDVKALLEPARGDRGGWRAQRVLHACPRCDRSGWLDVGFSSEQTAGKSVSRTTTWLAKGIVLDPEQRRYLEEREADVARRRQDRGDPPPSSARSRRR